MSSLSPFSSLRSRKLYCLIIALDLSPQSEKAIKDCVEPLGGTFIKVTATADYDKIVADNDEGNVNFIVIAHGFPKTDGSKFSTRRYNGFCFQRRDLLQYLADKFPRARAIGVYAGVCGGAIGSCSVGVDRIDYSGIDFDVTDVQSVIDWVQLLGLRVE